MPNKYYTRKVLTVLRDDLADTLREYNNTTWKVVTVALWSPINLTTTNVLVVLEREV